MQVIPPGDSTTGHAPVHVRPASVAHFGAYDPRLSCADIARASCLSCAVFSPFLHVLARLGDKVVSSVPVTGPLLSLIHI